MMGNPYRFPGKPSASYSWADGDNHVCVNEYFGAEVITKRWPVDAYRKQNRLAPQDLAVHRRIFRDVNGVWWEERAR